MTFSPLCSQNIGKENNFNLLRMIAALCVLFSHSYPICLGKDAEEPLAWLLSPYNLGRLAVWTFFVISGFFISASFDRRRTVKSFIAARLLRIYPGLLIALTITALVIGPLFTANSQHEYFSSVEPLQYILQNLSLLLMKYNLPGLFPDTPYPYAVNGSLWTLFYEMLCYVMVACVGLIASRMHYGFVLFLLLFALIHVYLSHQNAHDITFTSHQLTARSHELLLPFVMGMVMYRFRTRIPHSGLLALGCIMLIYAVRHTTYFIDAFMILWAYLVLYIGFFPSRWLHAYNRLGDYSYGTYLYAFPAQQIIAHLNHGITPLALTAIAIPLTIICGILSWYFVEKPALVLKRLALRKSSC